MAPWREGQHLQQMGDHHVAAGAAGFVERRSMPDGQRLGHVDLHMIDVLTIPDGFEQTVAESEGEDVERGLLAEEVVDAEDLFLGEGLVQGCVQNERALEVGAERLLHDGARAIDQVGIGEHLHDRQRRSWGHAQVVQAAGFTVEVGLARARSPDAPNMTMTCGCSGEMSRALASVGSVRLMADLGGSPAGSPTRHASVHDLAPPFGQAEVSVPLPGRGAPVNQDPHDTNMRST